MDNARNKRQEKIVSEIKRLGGRPNKKLLDLVQTIDDIAIVIIEAYVDERKYTKQGNNLL